MKKSIFRVSLALLGLSVMVNFGLAARAESADEGKAARAAAVAAGENRQKVANPNAFFAKKVEKRDVGAAVKRTAELDSSAIAAQQKGKDSLVWKAASARFKAQHAVAAKLMPNAPGVAEKKQGSSKANKTGY